MMQQKVIVDTGPLVAFFNKNDSYHQWAKDKFVNFAPPIITCESVISETCFLLQKYPNGVHNVFELIERKLITLSFDLDLELKSVKRLMSKYANIPMSLADACLVRLSEQISESVVCTIDSDFRIYRKNKRDTIPVIMPNDS